MRLRPAHPRPRPGGALPAAAAAAAVLLLWALLPPAPAPAQISRYLRTTNFAYFEYHESTARGPGPRTNRLKSQLTGAEGQYLSNEVVRVTQARFEYYPPDRRATSLVARTPLCLFDRRQGLLSSTSSLHAVANEGQLTLQGDSGFLYQMTNATFHVSNRVRTVIRASLLQSLDRPRP
ncbi:MAG: hypothetical protein RJA22_3284 [Verrucomicrobiota bacterium]|jgi:hypothetical protein